MPRKPRGPKISWPITGTHFLTRGAKTHFESGRPVEEGTHLKPYKKLLVDVTTSKAGLDKALAFANDLFNALDSVGYRVVLALHGEQFRRGQIDELEAPRKRQDYYHSSLWSPCRPTVVYVGTVAIGLAVIEMSEEVLSRNARNKIHLGASNAVSDLFPGSPPILTETLRMDRTCRGRTQRQLLAVVRKDGRARILSLSFQKLAFPILISYITASIQSY